MAEPTTHTFQASDGLTLAYHQLGTGRPVVLLHGYTSTARHTWVQTGIAARLVADGWRVVMPDFRGHGDCARPHEAAGYPPDALTSDALALLDHLALTDYALVGYSLGGRVAARILALGAKPRCAVIGGTGLEPILHASGRGENHRRILTSLGTFEPGSLEAQIEAYLTEIDADPVALLHVLDTFVDTPLEAFAGVEVPTLVIAGEADNDRGSVEDLAAVFRHGQLRRVPGDHFRALMAPELTDELSRFLLATY